MFTARTGTSKFFIKDITLTNVQTSGDIRVRMSVGGFTDRGNRVVDQLVSVGTASFIRPLWLLDEAETLEGLQVVTTAPATGTLIASISSATDATSYSTAVWVPAATTLYVMAVSTGVASGTTALNPNSITGNGTWTRIGGTTSTVASAANCSLDLWWFYSSVTGTSSATTVNFASTQHSCLTTIYPVTNTYPGTDAVSPWSSTAVPYSQVVSDADSAAPASTANSKTITLATLQTGQVVYWTARAQAGITQTPPTGMTEATGGDNSIDDLTGSQGKINQVTDYTTAPPWTSTTVGPATYSAASTLARAAVAVEFIPAGWVNCMVSGIEVR